MRTQEKKDSQLWQFNQSIITWDDFKAQFRFFGSVIYEEYGTDEMCLNLVKAIVEEVKTDKDAEKDEDEPLKELHYPQSPVP